MKRRLLIGLVLFVVWCLVPATLFSATYDLTVTGIISCRTTGLTGASNANQALPLPALAL